MNIRKRPHPDDKCLAEINRAIREATPPLGADESHPGWALTFWLRTLVYQIAEMRRFAKERRARVDPPPLVDDQEAWLEWAERTPVEYMPVTREEFSNGAAIYLELADELGAAGLPECAALVRRDAVKFRTIALDGDPGGSPENGEGPGEMPG